MAAKVACCIVGFGLVALVPSARAEIIGFLEAPRDFASGISNVQGWAYTNTPGAELVQPFAVLINGVEQFKVPCCGDRKDVQSTNPDAPLLTGFSGVYNWGLAWVDENTVLAADAPKGIGPPIETSITVSVVVTDTAGDIEILSREVKLFNPTPWPRSKLARWNEILFLTAETSADSPQGVLAPTTITSTCELSNDGPYLVDGATMGCDDMVFIAPDNSIQVCGRVYFDWDRTSQSFKLTSDCLSSGILK